MVGRPHGRNKATFTNFSGIVWTRCKCSNCLVLRSLEQSTNTTHQNHTQFVFKINLIEISAYTTAFLAK